MRVGILGKLLAINIPIIGMVIAVVWVAVDYLAAGYFSELMHMYNIEPDNAHRMFLDSVHRYLIQATIGAVALAVGLSYVLTRRVLRPLREMSEITRRISAGDYHARVDTATDDEIGELGQSFNRMADSLERVEKLRKSMVSDIAHELRTPLTNIRGYLEGISDGVIDATPEINAVLEAEILRLVRLVEDLHELTKADAARAYLKREEVSLRDLIDQVIALNRPEFERRDISVEVSVADDACRVGGDRDKLLQVLRNLIQNAWQYTRAGGAVRIRARRTAEGVRAEFTNTGADLEDADLPFIFERFYRGEKSRSRDSGGAGIGLSIVKELIEAHGGRVGVEKPDGETRFWFVLPG